MKLIHLEEVRRHWVANPFGMDFRRFFESLESLPTIDPIAIIDAEIEGITDNLKTGTMSNLEFTDLVAQKYILKKLKSRLLLPPKN